MRAAFLLAGLAAATPAAAPSPHEGGPQFVMNAPELLNRLLADLRTLPPEMQHSLWFSFQRQTETFVNGVRHAYET